MLKQPGTLRACVDQGIFSALYSRSLVYDACREDPAVDRLALALRHTDTVLAITRGGCNVLDHALAGVRLSQEHVPYLQSRLDTLRLVEGRARVPYLAGPCVPYYRFLGRKRAGEAR